MNRSTRTLIAFLSGAAVGSVLAILYAPDKGTNIRDRWNFRLSRTRDQLREFVEDLMENDVQTTAKAESEKVVNDAREKAQRLLADVETLMGQIKSNDR